MNDYSIEYVGPYTVRVVKGGVIHLLSITRVGGQLPNGAVIVDEQIRDPWSASNGCRESVVLCVLESADLPYATWRRSAAVTLTATGQPHMVEQVYWGDYWATLAEALADFAARCSFGEHSRGALSAPQGDAEGV